jgi:aspartate-semialdehyde dehydrogenase
MPLGSESLRVAIAGATSLLGKDLQQCMDESGFPAGEIRLFDEGLAAGTLTEVGGEPAVVQHIDEFSFQRVRFAFFTGSPAFALKHGPAAQRAGATVIDLTGGLAAQSAVLPTIPHLDAMFPAAANASVPAQAPGAPVSLCIAPSAAAIVVCSLVAALREFAPIRVAITFLQPASVRGAEGVEELESQTVKLLSLQPLPQTVFDTQIAFNLTNRWGAASAEQFSAVRARIVQETRSYVSGRAAMPAIALVQAPVFFGHAFSTYVEFATRPDTESLTARMRAAGFRIAEAEDPAPSNVTAAGESQAIIGPCEPDVSVDNACWFWGAADNLRLATANAVRIAERLLVS